MNIPARFKDLPARILSVAIAAPAVLLAVWAGGVYYDVLVGFAILIGMYEWLRFHEKTNPSVLCELASYGGLVLVWWLSSKGFYGFAFLTVAAITGFAYNLYSRAKLPNAEWLALGLPYLGTPMVALVALGNDPKAVNDYLIFYLLLVVWATDSGAYLFGRVIGGPKFAPAISPSKTWAGVVGATIGGISVGYVFANYVWHKDTVAALVLSVLLSVFTQAGDMFESYVKRVMSVKDSGRLLPGHGGVLDRIDGLLFAAVVMAAWHFAAPSWIQL